MSGSPLIEVRELGKRYTLGPEGANARPRLIGGAARHAEAADRQFWALKDVSFDINEGDRVGIIGRNGAGKSTLLKILSRVIYPTTGKAVVRGRVTSLLEVGTGFNNAASGFDNIYLNASLHGLSRKEIDRRVDDIIAFSELEKFIDTPIKHYSTGMRARLGFAIAAHLDPDILILDEVLAVGDAAFQQKCLARMNEVTGQGRTLLFVSHAVASINQFCNRCLWLEDGQLRDDGSVKDVTERYVLATLNLNTDLDEDEDDEADAAPAMALPAADGSTQVNGEAASTGPRAKLKRAYTIDRAGARTAVIATNEPLGVVMHVDVNTPGVYAPSIALKSKDDAPHLFWSAPPAIRPDELHFDVGRYRTVAWIPENLLNTGTYAVTLTMVDPYSAPFDRFFVREDALEFQVVEASAGENAARGIMPRDFPGVLRPRLTWDIDQERARA